MFDLLALAWQADLTRVATVLVARELSNRVYPRSGISEGFHNARITRRCRPTSSGSRRLNEYHTRTTIGSLLQKLGGRRTATARCSIIRSSFTAAA